MATNRSMELTHLAGVNGQRGGYEILIQSFVGWECDYARNKKPLFNVICVCNPYE